jgi:ubiquinone/menaquinone biosynthesis C-methylase UbiE
MAAHTPWQQVGDNAAEVYDRQLAPAMFAPWAPVLLDTAGVQPGEHVIDIACGTGVVTRLAAARVGRRGRIVGLDINAAMLAVARAHASAVAAAPIEWLDANAQAIPLPDTSFDVALCQQGLQQFPDPLTALREVRRILVDDGRFALCVWSRIEGNPGMVALVEALERHVGAAAANNRRAPFALGDADGVRALLDGAGFRQIQLRTLVEIARFPSPEAFVEAQLAATPLSTLGALSDEVRRAIARDVRADVQDYLIGGELAFPMEAHVALARSPSALRFGM